MNKNTMDIDNKLLEKLSKLSALSIDKQERSEIKKYLKQTLSHFEKIKQIDTKNVAPLVSPLKPPLITREDKPVEFSDKEKILDQAPQRQGSLVKVPPTL